MFIQTTVDFFRDRGYFKPNPKRNLKLKKKNKKLKKIPTTVSDV